MPIDIVVDAMGSDKAPEPEVATRKPPKRAQQVEPAAPAARKTAKK